MKFRQLDAPEELDSPFNSGWRFCVSSGASVLLLVIGASLLSILKGILICLA